MKSKNRSPRYEGMKKTRGAGNERKRNDVDWFDGSSFDAGSIG